ncbi:MAG: hypothetical protein LBG92_08675 [Prevotellaceae bacterium]|nr:hypothetical protein [Prevotellaceae bacterium]
MKKQLFKWTDIAAVAEASVYVPACGVSEYHVMISLTDRYSEVEKQFANIETAIEKIKAEYQNASLIFKRYFVSDAANQIEYIKDVPCAVSAIEQSPADGSKVAVWLYLTDSCKIFKDSSGTMLMEHSAYRHFFDVQMQFPEYDEVVETRLVFENYTKMLAARGCSLAANCIRTWIFVNGVDNRYAGMVNERRIIFESEGLTSETHYIASTGIEGRHANPKSLIIMDAYSVQGVDSRQIKHIRATDYLNCTSEYGVTFERATSVEYGDRKHIFVSGTASINNRGEILHPKSVKNQLKRIFENIEALLCNAEASMNDIVQMIVYLRDIADYHIAKQYIDEHEICAPYIIVRAAVCRPGWLVEIECIAIKSVENNDFSAF